MNRDTPITLGHTLTLAGLITGLVSALVTGLATRIGNLETRAAAGAVAVEQRLTRIEDKMDHYFARNSREAGVPKPAREETGG